MPKAGTQTITGERAVAPETQAAERGYQNAPGLTSSSRGERAPEAESDKGLSATSASRAIKHENGAAGHAPSESPPGLTSDGNQTTSGARSNNGGRDANASGGGGRRNEAAGRVAFKGSSGPANSSGTGHALGAGSSNGERTSLAISHVAPETAAAAVRLTAPSIMDLSRHLATVMDAQDAFDATNLEKSIRASDSFAMTQAHNRAREGQSILYAREEALRALISTLPAKTMADAAAQIAEISNISGCLGASEQTIENYQDAAEQIERMALGILPIVAAAAELRLADMAWACNDELRVARFDAVGVTS